MTGRTRANGEGSIFPYRYGYAASCWVRTPEGLRKKKWLYGKTGVPQLTGDLVHIRSRLCWSAAHGIGQQAKSPSNTTCGWSRL